MAIPTTRQELKDYCLRKCGDPVIEINIADSQVEDCIDDAIDFFRQYHYSGTEQLLLPHEVTAQVLTDKYITMPAGTTSVHHVYQFASASSIDSLFSVEYRLRFNDLRDVSSLNMADYVIAKQYLAQLDDNLNPEIRFQYNRYTNRLTLEHDWGNFPEGTYILTHGYAVVDPQEHTAMYGDWVLRELAAELVRKQWGHNLIKYEEIQLPGGVTLNGSRIVEEANREIERIKTEFIIKFQAPDEFHLA